MTFRVARRTSQGTSGLQSNVKENYKAKVKPKPRDDRGGVSWSWQLIVVYCNFVLGCQHSILEHIRFMHSLLLYDICILYDASMISTKTTCTVLTISCVAPKVRGMYASLVPCLPSSSTTQILPSMPSSRTHRSLLLLQQTSQFLW